MAAERSAGRDSPRLGSAPRPPLPGAAERSRRLPRRAGGGGCGRAPPRRVDGGRRCRGAAPPADSAVEPPGRVPPGPPLLSGGGEGEIPPPDGSPRWARPPHTREAGCGPARRGQLLLVLPHGSPALAQALRGGGTRGCSARGFAAPTGEALVPHREGCAPAAAPGCAVRGGCPLPLRSLRAIHVL